MDTALQVDLARPEAPAEQVLDTALGEAGSQLAVPQSNSPRQRSSLKGGYRTSSQIQLNPKKPSRDPSLSTSIHNSPANSLELGKFDETANVVILQPADEGFGAWSYVASAFAMFVVVWGRFLFISSNGWLETAWTYRL